MTEPEANNSHYPSASTPFGKKDKKKTTSAQYTYDIFTSRKQLKLREEIGKMTCCPCLWDKQTQLEKKENVSTVVVPHVFRTA